jgi:hypothetical protein
VATVISFIDCINRSDVDGLGALMTEDHQLEVDAEPALVGREPNIRAWRGYVASFPNYVIHPHRIVEQNGRVAVLGHTTGSHLGLSDDEERELLVLWVAEVADGLLRTWLVMEDAPERRSELGLDAP